MYVGRTFLTLLFDFCVGSKGGFLASGFASVLPGT